MLNQDLGPSASDVPVLQKRQDISSETIKTTKTPSIDGPTNLPRQRFNVTEPTVSVERAPEIPGFGKYSFEAMDSTGQSLPSPIGVKPAEQSNRNSTAILVLMAVTAIGLLSTGFGLAIGYVSINR